VENSVYFWGVRYDRNLNWNELIDNKLEKIKKYISLISEIDDTASSSVLGYLCDAVYQMLSNHNILWASKDKKKLEKILERANELLSSEMLQIDAIIQFETTVFMYKWKSGLLPTPCQPWFRERDHEHETRQQAKGHLRQIKTRKDFGKKSIRYRGTHAYNEEGIRDLILKYPPSQFEEFKDALKKHLQLPKRKSCWP
jgi:hypothetical protein